MDGRRHADAPTFRDPRTRGIRVIGGCDRGMVKVGATVKAKELGAGREGGVRLVIVYGRVFRRGRVYVRCPGNATEFWGICLRSN